MRPQFSSTAHACTQPQGRTLARLPWFMKLRLLVVWTMIAIPLHVSAVLPETGLYWDANQSGKGFYVEVQNGLGAVVFYAGDPNTGKSTYFVASGSIDGPVGGNLEPPRDTSGYAPVNGFQGDIYQVSEAPCLTCVSIGESALETIVGSAEVVFTDRAHLVLSITWTNVLPPNARASITYVLQRYDFAYPLAVDRQGGQWCCDLRGEWIFTDETDPMRVPWRFQFSQVTAVVDTSFQNEPMPAWDYVDPARQATMHCIANWGCSVSMNGELLFSMRGSDIGLDSMLGYLGSFAYPLSGVYRGTKNVIGMRIPPQPTQLATP